MGLATAVLSVFMFLQVGSGQTPSRPKQPNLLNSYSAEGPQLNHGDAMRYAEYVNYKEQKALQISDVGPPGSGTGQHHYLVLGKENMTYIYNNAFDICHALRGQNGIAPKWSWMRNATFKGTDEFKGMKVDVWTDKETGSILHQAAVLSSDPETVVYYLNTMTPQVFSYYSNSVPPESIFAVPPVCANAPVQNRPPHHDGSYLPQLGVHVSV